MADLLRYRAAEQLMRLAITMAGERRRGMTLDEMASCLEVSRKTAQRLRNALERLFPDLDYSKDADGKKRWHLPASNVAGLLAPSAEELTELKAAALRLANEGLTERSDLLEGLFAKISAMIDMRSLRRIEPDLELLLEAEGLAARAGPHVRIRDDVITDLRHSILESRRVILHYRRRDTGTISKPLVCPYGFLIGNRHYLVAYNLNPKVREYRTYVLGNIEQIDVQDRSFVRDENFDLKKFASYSFGLWRDEQRYDVVWHFSAAAAEDARSFNFHPSQTFEEQRDGSLIVRFSASGLDEMCWHLFTWGSSVEVLKPDKLRKKLSEMAYMVGNHHQP